MREPSVVGANLPRELWGQHQELRYLVVCGWNTVVGCAIFAGFYLALGDHIGYMIIAVFSHLIAVTQSFVTQRWIVFRPTGNWAREYLRFHITHLASLGLGLTGFFWLVEMLKTPPLAAQAIVTMLTVILSYFAHRHFTFNK